jgi:uncharacterized protein YqhQ
MKRYTNIIIIAILLLTYVCIIIETPYIKEAKDNRNAKHKVIWEEHEKERIRQMVKDNKEKVLEVLKELNSD